MTVAKRSVSLPADVERWAAQHAKQLGMTLSTFIAKTLQQQRERARREAAWAEVRDTLLVGKAITDAERQAVLDEWAATE